MQNRCVKCGHFVSSSWPFELCKSCRTTRDTRLLGVDEHGLTATPGEIQEADMPERFFYEDDEPLADVLNSPIAGEAMLTEPPDLPLADWERAQEALALVQSACEGAKSAGQKPVKRRWWHSVRWHATKR